MGDWGAEVEAVSEALRTESQAGPLVGNIWVDDSSSESEGSVLSQTGMLKGDISFRNGGVEKNSGEVFLTF